MTKTPIPTENSKTKGQNKNATKNFYYTTIADRLKAISHQRVDHLRSLPALEKWTD